MNRASVESRVVVAGRRGGVRMFAFTTDVDRGGSVRTVTCGGYRAGAAVVRSVREVFFGAILSIRRRSDHVKVEELG